MPEVGDVLKYAGGISLGLFIFSLYVEWRVRRAMEGARPPIAVTVGEEAER